MEKKEKRITFDEMPETLSIMSKQIDNLYVTLRRVEEEILAIHAQASDRPIKPRHIPIGIERAAEIVGKAKNTLYRYTSHGLIPCYKQGGNVYFFEDELVDWIRTGKNDELDKVLEKDGNIMLLKHLK